MKAKWLKMKATGAARYVYTVQGTAKELAEYVENQGEYCRFLQEDGSIGEEESATPIFYSTRIVGENPTLRWDAENERYRAEVTFRDAVIMDAANASYTNSSTNSSTNTEDPEEETTEDAELETVKTIKKKTIGRRGK